MRLLFITPTDLTTPRGGRAMLARLHRDALGRLFGADVRTHMLAPGSAGAIRSVAGQIDGTTPASCAAALVAADRHGADTLWLDGSNLGQLAQAAKRSRPRLRIVTFCHNVEARFFLGALRQTRRPRTLAVLIGNYLAERQAARHSDDLVALSARDGDLFARLYGRGADHVLPMAVADQLTSRPSPHDTLSVDAPLLFVGGAFYANLAGIDWFARHVAPRIDDRVEVIGHGMETLRASLGNQLNMQVIGPVTSLEAHYHAARATIAPIFDGSGMKTKVAEALMFGKPVIGTREAFSGYEEVAGAAGTCCDDADAFVAAIRAAECAPATAFNPALRALYERHYSTAAVEDRLRSLLGGLPEHPD